MERGATVAAARADVAGAMGRVMDVLRQGGVADRDIQTRHSSIQPEYRYDYSSREQTLVGYLVANTVTAKVRALGTVGDVVDAVAAAGGAAVQFTLEATAALEAQARERATRGRWPTAPAPSTPGGGVRNGGGGPTARRPPACGSGGR